jgi:hypothetical protein
MAKLSVGGLFPLHRGPFLFAPQFLTTSSWYSNFDALIKDISREQEIDVVVSSYSQRDTARAVVTFSRTDLIIDSQGGLFWVDPIGYRYAEDDFVSNFCGPSGVPRKFFRDLEDPSLVVHLNDDRIPISRFSEVLYRAMTNRFNRALRDGIAELVCCIGSPLAEATVLDPSKLKYLKLLPKDRESAFEVDNELDDGVASDGTQIFCLGIRLKKIPSFGREINELEVPKKDGRARIDWKVIDLFIKKGLSQRKGASKADIFRFVMARLEDESHLKKPSKTMLEDRIRKFFPGTITG